MALLCTPLSMANVGYNGLFVRLANKINCKIDRLLAFLVYDGCFCTLRGKIAGCFNIAVKLFAFACL